MEINFANHKYKKHRFFFFVLSAMLMFFGCKNIHVNIIVPDGYTGAVCLVKAKVATNELTIDTNGIGYINEETFDDLYNKPSVFNVSGKDLSANCVGFNPSSFWALGESESLNTKKVIHSKSFEIVPDSLIGKKQYYNVDLFEVADTLKIKWGE